MHTNCCEAHVRHKILFISKDDNWGQSKVLLQDPFLHAIMVVLRNHNTRNELHPLLKNSILSDDHILKNLMLAMSDEHEHFQNFKRHV